MKRSTLEDDVESTCLQSSLKRNKTHQTESEEAKEKISFNNLLSNNDGLVMSNIFTFCSPDDIPSLSLVSREWYDMFFSKGTIWKEWFDEWWKRTFSGSLREWTCLKSYEEEYELDFKVRLVKLLTFERKVRLGIITDDDAAKIQDYEAKQAEEEDNDVGFDDDSDDDCEDEDEATLEFIEKVEFFDLQDRKLCKIETNPNRFMIISNNGNVICFNKKMKYDRVFCLFHGGVTYPNIETCNYRSDCWIEIVSWELGVVVIQLQQIVEYLGFDVGNHSIACKIRDLIGLKEKIPISVYSDISFKRSDGEDRLGFVPWEIVKLCNSDNYEIHPVLLSYLDDDEIVKGLDHRFFTNFKLFVKLIEFINVHSSNVGLFFVDFEDKVDKKYFK